MAALGEKALVSLVEWAGSIGLAPLVEVHTEDEVERAVAGGPRSGSTRLRDSALGGGNGRTGSGSAAALHEKVRARLDDMLRDRIELARV